MIKAIIFDFSGVIAPLGSKKKLSQLFSKHSELSAEKILITIEKYWKLARVNEIDSQVFWKSISEDLGVDKNEFKLEMLKYSKPDERMLQLILKLKKNYQLALLSNHVEEWLEIIIQKYKLNAFFDFLVLSYQVKLAKPDRKIYQKAKNLLKIDYNDCLFIDDKGKNILAAKELGMKTILFTDYRSLIEDLKKLKITFD